MRRHSIVTSALLATALMGVALSACQSGPDVVMWGPCGPGGDPTGTDGVYSMVCKDGEWTPVMTVGEWVRASRGEDFVIAPVPERPTTTTTSTVPPTSSTSTTSTSTTSTSTTSTSTTSTASTTSTTVPAGTLTTTSSHWSAAGFMANIGQVQAQLSPAPPPDLTLDPSWVTFSDPSFSVSYFYWAAVDYISVGMTSSATPVPVSFTMYVNIPGYQTLTVPVVSS